MSIGRLGIGRPGFVASPSAGSAPAGTFDSTGRVFSGVGVTPNSVVTIYLNGAQVATTTANSGGAWSYTFSSAPAAGAIATAAEVTSATAAPGPSTVPDVAPVNTVAPSITYPGSAPQVGVPIALNDGVWPGAVNYYRSLYRVVGNTLVNLNVSGTSYTPVQADLGYDFRFRTAGVSAGGLFNAPIAAPDSIAVIAAAGASTTGGTGTLDFSDPNNSGLQPGL